LFHDSRSRSRDFCHFAAQCKNKLRPCGKYGNNILLHCSKTALRRKIFPTNRQFPFAFGAGLRLYIHTQPLIGGAELRFMSKAKVIAIGSDVAQRVYALASSALVTLIVLDIVSLLIGGVLRPLTPEW
jgi:hypothetical protein